MVQGVCFRMFVQEHAHTLGCVGMVKNTPDGGVSVLAEGEKGALEELRRLCMTGPSAAQVSDVQEKWEKIDQLSFDSFEIQY